MVRAPRWKLLLAALAAMALVVMFMNAPRFLSTMFLYDDAAAVPSTEGEHAQRFADAIGEGQRIARDLVYTANIPGVSVAVGVGDEVVWSNGFGWADLDTRTPVTPETRFRLGTASTVFTAAAVGRLVDQGHLKLDDDIQLHVPGFAKKPWPVTLRQVMGHVAGLDTDGGEGPLSRERCESPAEAVRHFGDRDLLFRPGSRYEYSTYGGILTSAAVEAAAGQPFMVFMRDQIFQPLGMNETTAESPAEENPERIGEAAEDPPFMTAFAELVLRPIGVGPKKWSPSVPYYVPRFGDTAAYGVNAMRAQNLSCYAGAMAFLSSPSDLVRFSAALRSGRLLQPDTVQQLQTPQRLTSGDDTGHGLGWEIATTTVAGERQLTAGTDAELRGRRVGSLVMLPARGLVVAVMSNLANAETSLLAQNIAEAFVAAGAR